jgi:hypothetical protein
MRSIKMCAVSGRMTRASGNLLARSGFIPAVQAAGMNEVARRERSYLIRQRSTLADATDKIAKR